MVPDDRRGDPAFLGTPGCARLIVVALAVLWALLPAWLQTVPHADNIEQLDWAHALQWGYVKHPPLPTWLLHAGIAAFGESALLTYALATACCGAALLILWACARELLDAHAALLVLLLTGADYYLMGRGSFLNHNTVMLPFVAASAWAVLRIVRGDPARAWPWLALGLAQAFGLLTKYQMAVVIGANALALLAAGAWRRPRFAAHALLAAAATVLPLLPHAIWLQQHDFSSFSYAGENLLAGLPWLESLRRTAGFVAQQIGRFAPAICAAAVGLILARAIPGLRASGAAPPPEAPARRALAVLALAPPAVVVALGVFAGVAVQNHWGASTTLLLPLFAVAAWPTLRRVGGVAMLAGALLAQAGAAGWYAAVARRSAEFHYTFAARPMAALAAGYWRDHESGALQILVGPDWETGALSLELANHPDVIASGDRRQAPWIDDARIARCGALVLWRPDQPVAAQVGGGFAQRAASPGLLRVTTPRGVSALGVGIIAPEGNGC